jgi:2-haloacid dehalogenase
MAKRPQALLFDVFGTVVDWRGSIVRELRRVGRRHGVRADWGAFADAWRSGYRPAMDRVRRGDLPWRSIDELHLEILVPLLESVGFRLREAEVRELNAAWHRLKPWPDSARGLERLKRHFVIGTLSNGNTSLLIDLAKRGRLPWDVIFSAELFRHYKPDPEVYVGAVGLLGVPARNVMLAAAHKDDLAAARRCGLRTAYVCRPMEHGRAFETDLDPDRRSDFNAVDLVDLARQLCAAPGISKNKSRGERRPGTARAKKHL